MAVLKTYVVGSTFLALFFTLLELRINPWYAQRQKQKIAKIFNAVFLSDEVAQFNWNDHAIFIYYHHKLVMAQVGNSDFVEFHVMRSESNFKEISKHFKLGESTLGDKETYLIASTNSFGLKRMKRKFDRLKD